MIEEEEIVAETLRPNIGLIAKLPIFNGEISKVSGFLIVCRLYIRIRIKNTLVEKQVQ